MTDWPSADPAAMNAFYGNPDSNRDFEADANWVALNIVKLTPPYPLFYPQEQEVAGRKQLLKRQQRFSALRVHRRCAASLERVLQAIGRRFSPAEIAQYELDICGGVFNFRLMRGGTSLSIHSWGAAIDLSHLINSWKRPYDAAKGMMPAAVVEIFADEGWQWGGRWHNADAMHFQAAHS